MRLLHWPNLADGTWSSSAMRSFPRSTTRAISDVGSQTSKWKVTGLSNAAGRVHEAWSLILHSCKAAEALLESSTFMAFPDGLWPSPTSHQPEPFSLFYLFWEEFQINAVISPSSPLCPPGPKICRNCAPPTLFKSAGTSPPAAILARDTPCSDPFGCWELVRRSEETQKISWLGLSVLVKFGLLLFETNGFGRYFARLVFF